MVDRSKFQLFTPGAAAAEQWKYTLIPGTGASPDEKDAANQNNIAFADLMRQSTTSNPAGSGGEDDIQLKNAYQFRDNFGSELLRRAQLFILASKEALRATRTETTKSVAVEAAKQELDLEKKRDKLFDIKTKRLGEVVTRTAALLKKGQETGVSYVALTGVRTHIEDRELPPYPLFLSLKPRPIHVLQASASAAATTRPPPVRIVKPSPPHATTITIAALPTAPAMPAPTFAAAAAAAAAPIIVVPTSPPTVVVLTDYDSGAGGGSDDDAAAAAPPVAIEPPIGIAVEPELPIVVEDAAKKIDELLTLLASEQFLLPEPIGLSPPPFDEAQAIATLTPPAAEVESAEVVFVMDDDDAASDDRGGAAETVEDEALPAERAASPLREAVERAASPLHETDERAASPLHETDERAASPLHEITGPVAGVQVMEIVEAAAAAADEVVEVVAVDEVIEVAAAVADEVIEAAAANGVIEAAADRPVDDDDALSLEIAAFASMSNPVHDEVAVPIHSPDRKGKGPMDTAHGPGSRRSRKDWDALTESISASPPSPLRPSRAGGGLAFTPSITLVDSTALVCADEVPAAVIVESSVVQEPEEEEPVVAIAPPANNAKQAKRSRDARPTMDPGAGSASGSGTASLKAAKITAGKRKREPAALVASGNPYPVPETSNGLVQTPATTGRSKLGGAKRALTQL